MKTILIAVASAALVLATYSCSQSFNGALTHQNATANQILDDALGYGHQ